MKAAFYTLGCKVNQYDTQMMMEKLVNAGFLICSFDDVADIYIINTCTVTQISDKKSRNIISRARRRNSESIIVVCGCFSQVAPEDVAGIDGVDIVIGTSNRADILDYIAQYNACGKKIIDVSRKNNIRNENITTFSEKTRAIIKIEDGCRNFCSYCLISFARGEIVSKPLDKIIEEAKILSMNGYKEIVLTGIHLSSYGKDLDGPDLSDAINEVSKIDGIKRIRLGSLEPMIISEEFVSKIKDINKLCHSFHLSLQSGCNKILKDMNRKYTTEQYMKSVNLLKNAFEDCALTTDVIVGFPGETEEDFDASCDFIQNVGFAKIHIFPYSKRKGTKAAKMPCQITKELKHLREKKLAEIEQKSRETFLTSMIDKSYPILVERCENGICNGFTPNYISIYFSGNDSIVNSIVNVKVLSIEKSELKGILE